MRPIQRVGAVEGLSQYSRMTAPRNNQIRVSIIENMSSTRAKR